MDDLRRGKLTLPWKGFAEHCDYTKERFASILKAIPPHECPNEDIVSVLQEIIGYFAIHVLRDAEKVLEEEHKSLILQYLKAIAEADGEVSTEEQALLERISATLTP